MSEKYFLSGQCQHCGRSKDLHRVLSLLKPICLSFILLFSVVTFHNPYLHEIALSINASHEKFFFVFNKPDIIFAIISFIY